jgi:PIN domain nuclease of toxin-antitoxin system
VDASALLAVLNQEAGAQRLTPELLNAAASSTVSLAEIQGKPVDQGLSSREAWESWIGREELGLRAWSTYDRSARTSWWIYNSVSLFGSAQI